MATEIGVWQIINGKLEHIDVSMAQAGRKEVEDLEKWIKNNPIVLGQDILIIGEQVRTKSGPLDFLGIDKSGNLVVIELKRDRLPRDALSQAIDYVSDVASWDLDKINEECLKYTKNELNTEQELEEYLSENFGDIDLESIIINGTQRILLVGFSIDEALERMIDWLSNNYGVGINALILKYIKTKDNEELLARTMIIPEDIEKERSPKRSIRFKPPSDEPGTYEEDELEELLKNYLKKENITPKRIKNIFLPLCLKNPIVSRDLIKEELIKRNEASEEGKAGIIVTTISKEIGIAERDYLRQIIRYDKPNSWEKENYRLVDDYKDLVNKILDKLNTSQQIN